MADEIDLNAYITSPFASDLKKQRDAAFDSARNIRKVTETPEEYRLRRAQEQEAFQQKITDENTDVLMQRLANLDIANINTKNRAAIENMIQEAQSIKFFAFNNRYNTNAIDFNDLNKAIAFGQTRLNSLKSGKEQKDIGTGIYSDSYRPSSSKNSFLDKLIK